MIRSEFKNKPVLVLEEVTDPDEIERSRKQSECHRRNVDWLQSHWEDVLPQARGKFLVVAGQEAHIADTPNEAWRWAEANHPDDNGAFVRYVRKEKGPRIYASRRLLGNG